MPTPNQQNRIFLLLLGVLIAVFAIMIIATHLHGLLPEEHLPAYQQQDATTMPVNTLMNVTIFSLR